MPAPNPDCLELFHPHIADWFRERFPEPTPTQTTAWPVIAEGKHCLITAPTGSGKTLTAFLWSLHQLYTEQWEPGRTRVLYISPLKALNNDIRRNLFEPMHEIAKRFGQDAPEIQARVRSGDTPQSERRRMLRRPPEILITTPESLNLLLSSASGRELLGGIQSVILDEIHAVFDSKRGTHLITAIDRLVPLAGEFQRVALSATIHPLETVADFVGGSTWSGPDSQPNFHPRPVEILAIPTPKRYDLSVRFIPPPDEIDEDNTAWDPLVEECREIAKRNQSTLFFVNSRRICEKITYLMNRSEEGILAFAHHGSLSREIRSEVESRMKAGELKAIVATNSLELGIDVGALDAVVMIQSPSSVASAVQRLGRAGHQVGATSRGVLFPIEARDILESVVLAQSVPLGDLEPMRPVEKPLDVLAQMMVSMTAVETWDIDAMYTVIRSSWPFRNLTREQFERVLDMQNGRYADTRIRELKPRLSVDRLDNTIAARKGARMALYSSGGVIPDRGYFHLRHKDSGSRIGQLDEEFVWEARIGNSFTLGTQSWTIQKITHNDVFVTPAKKGVAAPPFWRADEGYRDAYFANAIASFLSEAEVLLYDTKGWNARLAELPCDRSTGEELTRFLKSQRSETGCALPHRKHMVIEHVDSGPKGAPGRQTILHTVWGGKVNRPFALAIEAAWETKYGEQIRSYTSDYGIVLVMSEPVDAAEILQLVSVEALDDLLRARLEMSGFFGAQFRIAAGIALMLPRRKFGERLPLWVTRLRSEKLLESVKKAPDFPILLEAWRASLRDELDLEALRERLSELASGVLEWSEVDTQTPSPFAAGDAWRQVNEYMYEDDKSRASAPSSLSDELIQEILDQPSLRPDIPREIAERFRLRRQRLALGYSPEGGRELLDWVKERVAIPEAEWEELLLAMQRDHESFDPNDPAQINSAKLAWVIPGNRSRLLVARERLAEIQTWLQDLDPARPIEASGFDGKDPEAERSPNSQATMPTSMPASMHPWGEWISYYGPLRLSQLASMLGLSSPNQIPQDEQTVVGRLTEPAPGELEEDQLCDRGNLEILLRMTRADAVPQVEAKALDELPSFLALWQGFFQAEDEPELLHNALEQLAMWPSSVAAWERDILPARRQGYLPLELDGALRDLGMIWLGTGEQQVAFCFPGDRDLLGAAAPQEDDTQEDDEEGHGKSATIASAIAPLFIDPAAQYDFASLSKHWSGTAPALAEIIWQSAWQGEISTGDFAVLRQGALNKFTTIGAGQANVGARGGRATRGGYRRWKSALPQQSAWRLLPAIGAPEGLLEEHELQKERARIVLERYGIVFRQLLMRELPDFQWRGVFRSLRLMELSGEILSGYFFKDIPGPQFILPKAFQLYRRAANEDHVFWINACDPISPCSLKLDALHGLPRRIPSNYLVYRGSQLLMVCENAGKRLTILKEAEEVIGAEIFACLTHLMERDIEPMRRLYVEEINGENPNHSAYLDALRSVFHVIPDAGKVQLLKRVT